MLSRLVLANFRQHKIRSGLTVAAIALAVSLVVAVTSGYASLESAVYKYFSQYTGATDVQISSGTSGSEPIDESIADEIRSDPSVHEVYGRLEERKPLLGLKGEMLDPPSGLIVGIRRDHESLDQLQLSSGVWFQGTTGDVAVLDEGAAHHMGASLHDTIFLSGLNGPKKLEVVGIVHKPAAMGLQLQTIYVPLETLQNFENMPGKLTRILVALNDPKTDVDFSARWKSRLLAADPKLHLRLASESRLEMARQMRGMHLISYMGGMVAMLAATFIVFSALSMGVVERSRTLAMLRAIGTFRLQLAMLVVIEGIVFAIVGVDVGVPMGAFWMRVVAWRYPYIFGANGLVLSRQGMIFGASASLVSALIASLLPAWNATRVSPLEALSPQGTPPRNRGWVICALVGLLLISIDPIVLLGPWDPQSSAVRSFRFYEHFALGLPGLFIGFFLLAPTFVFLVERLVGPPIAWLLGVRPSLLRQQLSSSGVWRAAGTCAALMVGLSILIVMQTQGRTLIKSWRLPVKFPDIFIISALEISPKDYPKIAGIDGIVHDRLLPVAMPVSALRDLMFSLPGSEGDSENVVFFGLDPDLAMSMIELDFRDPSGHSYPEDQQPKLRADAAAKMKQGGYILVTQEFQALKGKNTGDTLAIDTSSGMKEFKIAGVVWTPGMDVFKSIYDVGPEFESRTVASVFGSMDDARKYFGTTGVRMFAAELEHGISKDDLVKKIKEQVNPLGLAVFDVRHIKSSIQQAALRLLDLLSTIAYAAMAVAALGVANTIMASIRSRRWQFGVLRSIGVTRGHLLRLLLAEALLLGIVGAALGVAAGVEMTFNANAMSQIVLGVQVDLQWPWKIIEAAAAAIVVVSIVASIAPAVGAAFTKPLTLLSAGRAAG